MDNLLDELQRLDGIESVTRADNRVELSDTITASTGFLVSPGCDVKCQQLIVVIHPIGDGNSALLYALEVRLDTGTATTVHTKPNKRPWIVDEDLPCPQHHIKGDDSWLAAFDHQRFLATIANVCLGIRGSPLLKPLDDVALGMCPCSVARWVVNLAGER